MPNNQARNKRRLARLKDQDVSAKKQIDRLSHVKHKNLFSLASFFQLFVQVTSANTSSQQHNPSALPSDQISFADGYAVFYTIHLLYLVDIQCQCYFLLAHDL